MPLFDIMRFTLLTFLDSMEAYFVNMTSFSLFKAATIEAKLASMQNLAEGEALVAAMFCFSARFDGTSTNLGRPSDCPAPSYFARIASSQIEYLLNQCEDGTPAFCVLQACILVTFYQLTLSVRSRSWRTLGNCIRLAYEMNLHAVDASYISKSNERGRNINLRQWSHLEERRRAWWAIWEMDVFASTIRRLPTAIDWSQNWTLLPVDNRYWFNDLHQESSFLVHDPELRWKSLSQSGNTSPKAWFIVINSLMRNTQLIVYSRSSMQPPGGKRAASSQAELTVMANSLACTTLSLPSELSYRGDPLDFRNRVTDQNVRARQHHGDTYAIHLMIQLCRFMIYHHKICARAPWLSKCISDDLVIEADATAASEWSNYISAADEIVGIIRNCSREHYKYVNPFLMNTVWFAGAAQCACKIYGPSSFDKRLLSSNIELLSLTIERFISFWDSTESLIGKLKRMEAGLEDLVARSNDSRTLQNHIRERQEAQNVSDSTSNHFSPIVPDSATAQYQMTLADSSLPYAGVDAMVDGSSIPTLYDFMQPSAMTDQNGIMGSSLNYFPYGLEELFIYNAT
jgi:hypothetical protein